MQEHDAKCQNFREINKFLESLTSLGCDLYDLYLKVLEPKVTFI